MGDKQLGRAGSMATPPLALPKGVGSLPVPCLEGIAGSLKEVALHYHATWCIHIKLHFWLIIGKVLRIELALGQCPSLKDPIPSQSSPKQKLK